MANRFSLKNLLAPLPVRDFRAKRLREVTAGLRYDRLEHLLEDSGASTTRLWFSSKDTLVPIADALKYYGAGMTLFFNRHDDLLVSWRAKIEKELQLRPTEKGSGVLPSIFASPAGHGSALHFDRFDIL